MFETNEDLYQMSTENEIRKSFKWSTITEICVKLITPILNAILARILLPEAFAPLATVTMIISLGEIFVESGFKKYLIQHKFESDEEYKNALDVALWTNVAFASFVWLLIAVFSKPLATFLGNSEIWQAIMISGVILPIHGVIGVLSSKLHKDLKFKKLFLVRLTTALIPLFVTIPLAILGLDYWSLIIGNIAYVVAWLIVLVIISKYKFRLYYSITVLKEMLKCGVWTLLDGMAVWLTTWIDSFIIARYMNEYYLGMYKNSLSTVNTLFSIVMSAIGPVLFVGLSKLQGDDEKFSSFFNSTQRTLAMVLIPLGVGVLLYKDFAVQVLFGNNWLEAANIVGIVAFTTALRMVFVSICSDAYRAKGKFKIPLILQIVDICLIVPICVLSAKEGFWNLVYARAFIKLDLIIPELIIMKYALNIDVVNQLKKLLPIFGGTILMTGVCLLLKLVSSAVVWNVFSIIIAIVIYGAFLIIIPSSRKDLKDLIRKTKD